jgi:hypothetical protein
MSTTPSTSETAAGLPYTVLGGPRRDRVRRYSQPLTFLVLGRGDRLFRSELLRDLLDRRAGEILWVEGPEPSADLETLSREFPEVRFLLVKAPCTAGERVNLGMGESRAPMVMVLWSDTRISRFTETFVDAVERSGALCGVPVARTAHEDVIPSWQSPTGRKRRFAVSFRAPSRDAEPTLFPFDYCGLYNRLRFSQSGGYDAALRNPYWQKLDFGFRCFLWGERVQGTTGLTLTYTNAPADENATPDASYKLFWLKCLAVRARGELGYLPFRRLPEYLLRSDTGPVAAVSEFRAARAWVRTHRFRFRRDPRDLLERWETI